MYYVYVLRSKKDMKLYTGFTNDLKKRFNEHNKGKVTSTRHRTPLSIIYYEVCGNMYDAQAREKYLKTGMGKRYIRNRLKHFFISNGMEQQ